LAAAREVGYSVGGSAPPTTGERFFIQSSENAAMLPSLRAILTEIVDYAGLFPPAGLELEPAVRNFADYRTHAQSWMLSRFICPAGKLAALSEFADELFLVDTPFRFSVLGRGGDNRESFCANLREDFAAAENFRDRHGARVSIDAFEVKLPADWAGSNTTGQFFRRVSQVATDAGRRIGPRFFEISLDGNWRDHTARVVEHLADFNSDTERSQQTPAGVKLRCGGVKAAAFPTCEQVATVIELCRDATIPLKFTAGLHHPIRHHSADVHTQMHGFINVFLAGVLAYSLGLEHHDIRAIVEEEDPNAFSFSDDFLGWHDAEATISEIHYARKHRVISFGSCSFEEPWRDLKRLGWL